MAFGIYVHIPYCIQRCRYCDFATFEWKSILPPEEYISSLTHELRARSPYVRKQALKSIYFGGGTPSLIPAPLIVSVIEEIAKCGFEILDTTEITIEVNPKTITDTTMRTYLAGGVNRFSLGVQSFNDSLLKLCGREHSAEETRQTIKLFQKHNTNFSLDLLFALPTQTEALLQRDLDEFLFFQPPHISAYCLTLPTEHEMNRGRPEDEVQLRMFAQIQNALNSSGYSKYEISNFSKPKFESQHNLLYWTDQEYWGLGLSAHSYLKTSLLGSRFWNPKTLPLYLKQARQSLALNLKEPQSLMAFLPKDQQEHLQHHEALTDFCHTSLRLNQGLSLEAVQEKFGPDPLMIINDVGKKLASRGLLRDLQNNHWVLSPKGELLSNLVFEEFTFLPTSQKNM